MKRLVAVAVALLMHGHDARAGELTIEGGGTALASGILTVQPIFESETGHTLNVVQSSAVSGLIALVAGRVDAAAGAHPVDDLLAAAALEGVVIDGSTLVATPIEENRLIAILHRTNPVKRLSREELKAIFTGGIVNWSELGGSDLPIEVVWAEETKGQNMQFTREVLGGEPVTADVRAVRGYRSIVNLVSVLPSGIGIVPVGLSSALTHAPEVPAITCPICLITRGKPSPIVQQFLDVYRREMDFLR